MGLSIHHFELMFALGSEVDDVAAQAFAVGTAFRKKSAQLLRDLRSLVLTRTFLERMNHGFQPFQPEEKLERSGELFGVSRQRRSFVVESARLLPAGFELFDVRIACALGHPTRGIQLVKDRQKPPGVDADFLDHDRDIPRWFETGSGRFGRRRLGVCRDGAEYDSQPHCFNLSCGAGEPSAV